MIRVIDPAVVGFEFRGVEFAMGELGNLSRFESAVGERDMRDIYFQRIIERGLGHIGVEKEIFVSGQMPEHAVIVACIDRQHPQQTKTTFELENKKIARLKILHNNSRLSYLLETAAAGATFGRRALIA
jgi:hypothetical protein